ncbi:hypothetical protein CRENBAI_004153 [Crenichthys baileyi]|uniref:Uncharacterized protein n=1 Tax=Crenichthys baileyi TaxID=28760 RepID=A0AAV9S8E4_9TELE
MAAMDGHFKILVNAIILLLLPVVFFVLFASIATRLLITLFTNALMAKFNMKGKGKQGKRSLEKTKVYGAIKDGNMNGDEAATEDIIRIHAAEHLKHAPQRSGGGGHKAITQD